MCQVFFSSVPSICITEELLLELGQEHVSKRKENVSENQNCLKEQSGLNFPEATVH